MSDTTNKAPESATKPAEEIKKDTPTVKVGEAPKEEAKKS